MPGRATAGQEGATVPPWPQDRAIPRAESLCKTQPGSGMTSGQMKLSGLIKMLFFFLFSLLVNKINTGQRSTKNRLCALCTPKDALQPQTATTKAELMGFTVGECVSFCCHCWHGRIEICACLSIPEWPQHPEQVLVKGFAILTGRDALKPLWAGGRAPLG